MVDDLRIKRDFPHNPTVSLCVTPLPVTPTCTAQHHSPPTPAVSLSHLLPVTLAFHFPLPHYKPHVLLVRCECFIVCFLYVECARVCTGICMRRFVCVCVHVCPCMFMCVRVYMYMLILWVYMRRLLYVCSLCACLYVCCVIFVC